MASTGGPPPPPRGFDDFSSSNGNSPPDIEIHLATSSSDILLPPHPNLASLNFLSAKNSIELHKKSLGRIHSLPSSFGKEDYDRVSKRDEDGTSSSVTSGQKEDKASRKSVGWADMSQGLKHSANSSSDENEIEANDSTVTEVGGTVTQMNNILESDEPFDLSTKEHKCGSDIVAEDAELIPAKPSANMLNILEHKRSSHTMNSDDETVSGQGGFTRIDSRGNPNLEDELSRRLINNTLGQSGSEENVSNMPEGDTHRIVNGDDGLVNTLMDIPRAALNENDDYSLKSVYSQFSPSGGTPRNEEMIYRNVSGYPDMRTPPMRDESGIPIHLHSDQNRMNLSDEDDEYLEPAKTQLVIPSSSELPVPDPYYVSRNYPMEYPPLIARVYKKDCRTWLWKSKSQREARLLAQKNEDLQTTSD